MNIQFTENTITLGKVEILLPSGHPGQIPLVVGANREEVLPQPPYTPERNLQNE